MNCYHPADASWFSQCRFGVAFHWTAQSMPASGTACSYFEAVDSLDVDLLVNRVADCRADYLLFTLTHARHLVPAPCAAVDRLIDGYTARRDLPADLIRACKRRGLRFFLYYNHSCNQAEDAAWERAVGYHGADKAIFADNLCDIVGELSQRYGQDLDGWWYDSPYSLDPSGPNNTVSTDMKGYRFPWERFTQAAKRGHGQRLVSYNPGMQPHLWYFLYTTHQDYLAGEANDLVEPPQGAVAPNGLANHRWICLDNPDWVHSKPQTPLVPPRFGRAELSAYLSACRAAQTPLTINVDIDQTGAVHPQTLQLLASL